MFLIDFIGGIITWVFRIWEKLPASAKKEIIFALTAAFEPLFRIYYRNWKQGRQ